MAEAIAPPASKPSDSQISERFDIIFTKALKFVSEALLKDEEGIIQEAIDLYKTSLIFIEEALGISRGSTEGKKKKLESAKKNVVDRLKILKNQQPQSKSNNLQNQENELLEIMEIDGIETATSDENCNATELLAISEAQIFYISADGLVSAPSYPSKLGIYKFRNEADRIRTGAPAFLKVGSWTYPLVPNQSPSLQSIWGAYMFPDLEKGVDHAIGVILPDNTTLTDRQTFENLIKEYSMLSIEEGEEAVEESEDKYQRLEHKRGSEKVAEGIERTAEYIAKGVDFGVHKISGWLLKGGSAVRDRMAPTEKDVQVRPDVQKGLKTIRTCSKAAVSVSSTIVSCVGSATKHLAVYAAPHLRKGAEKVLPKSWTTPKENQECSKLDDALLIGAHGVQGAVTVYLSLEHAAFTLARGLADESVKTVKHKYGEQSGAATEDALYSAVNIGMTVNNAKNLGVKAVAKRIAKDTGKEVAKDLIKTRTEMDKPGSSKDAL
ncbi:DgyrCDS10907 [Dimorphilus gyrociliatus]|uniref:DgyrCDS10907 n=1 Tax=Dimorphilus gyrociliatus TaxID=2664684 RepID=A0A7I8W1S3_9ANNE|nr:DgyrCDS10907 [Dimorphilus gyrociliatus]